MALQTLASTLDLVCPRGPSKKPAGGVLVEIRPHSVPWSAIARLCGKLGVNSATFPAVIGISERTAVRRRKEGFLKPDEADRLLRVARVLEEASRVFNSESKAALWLREPSVMLSGAAPLTLLSSDAGTQLVSEELIRIDFGDFA